MAAAGMPQQAFCLSQCAPQSTALVQRHMLICILVLQGLHLVIGHCQLTDLDSGMLSHALKALVQLDSLQLQLPHRLVGLLCLLMHLKKHALAVGQLNMQLAQLEVMDTVAPGLQDALKLEQAHAA